MTFVRGSNPIWTEFDLNGDLFDDTFYLFVLENTIPYFPATVYHDPDGNVPWTNPIQFLGNGTLPVDIFFNPDDVYRLEFRQGPTQSDPLIYLVENYSPTGGGNTPVDTVAIATENQITNPQFSLISFSSPYVQTSVTDPDPIEVAPGWFLNLTGTGNITIEQTPLSDALENPTNAPYALHIVLSGTWTGTPYLSQRFDQNGILWSNKYVSSSITARIEGAPQSISAILKDSNGLPLVSVLDSTSINSDFEEYQGVGLVPASTNPDVPPAAYIEYQLSIPTSVDIYLTSFQLKVSDFSVLLAYDQDTIERQVDHTFHYYRESLLLQPKDSILTGWDFGLNPWQFRTTAVSNFVSFGYVADQTFVVQQRYVEVGSTSNVAVGQSSAATNNGFVVSAVTSTNEFAIGQYIDPTSLRPFWGNTFSTLVKLNAQKQNPNLDLRVKMRLIYRSSLPSPLSQTEPIATWTAGSTPIFGVGWTAIAPKNDPVYNLSSGLNTLTFEGMTLPASAGANMTLGIIVYTIDSMIQSGTPDNIVFNRVSLVPNEFAIDSNILTFDQTLNCCQYYYEKTYDLTVLPGDASSSGELIRPQRILIAGGVKPSAFDIEYNTIKRINNPTLSFYSPNGSAAGFVLSVLYNDGAPIAQSAPAITNWVQGVSNGQKAQSFTANGNTTLTAGVGNEGFIAFQYTADARLAI